MEKQYERLWYIKRILSKIVAIIHKMYIILVPYQ